MKKRSYYQVKAEKAKKEILDLISEVNDGFAEEAIKYLGKELNSQTAWKLAGKREGLKKARMVLSDNNIFVDGCW